jgi:hypothetical protein
LELSFSTHPKHPGGSVVTINENHELWINDEKTHLLISEATIDMINVEWQFDQKEHSWERRLFESDSINKMILIDG